MSNYVTKKINSLGKLIEELENDFKNYGGTVWYRGQTNESYTLLPSYLRQNTYALETTLLAAFKENAVMLINNHPKNDFEWMFQMQHYGIPTRLLDWSESPLVALYFALQKSCDCNNAVIWALKPTKLNENARIINKNELYFIPSFQDEVISGYSMESLTSTLAELSPVAVIATRNNPRIQAQMGVFTIHHKEKIEVENVGDKSHITKYVIEKEAKKNILMQLELLGITKFQLFPELSSIRSIMKKRELLNECN